MKEQVLNQLDVLSRKTLVPRAKTRFNIIQSQRARCECTQVCAAWGVHRERLWSHQGNNGK
eukprot:8340821-Prorocentrum_lima.AAC.1